jgi:hypothetical protein
MEEREANRALQLAVALDDHVGLGPTPCPGCPVLAQQGLVADGLGVVEGRTCSRLGRGVCGEPLEHAVAPSLRSRNAHRASNDAARAARQELRIGLRAERDRTRPGERREAESSVSSRLAEEAAVEIERPRDPGPTARAAETRPIRQLRQLGARALALVSPREHDARRRTGRRDRRGATRSEPAVREREQ